MLGTLFVSFDFLYFLLVLLFKYNLNYSILLLCDNSVLVMVDIHDTRFINLSDLTGFVCFEQTFK